MEDYTSQVTETIIRTHNVVSVRAARPSGLTYKPGQCANVMIQSNGNEVNRFLSFSSSPTEPFIEFTKKISGSDFSLAFTGLAAGEDIRLRGPGGVLTYEGEFPEVLFIAGGIGITPIRSMLRYAADEKVPSDRVLLYASRAEGDMAFREELEEMARTEPDFRLMNILNKPSEKWQGAKGFISADFIAESVLDLANRTAFICGSPGFVKCMERDLKKLKVPDDRIIMELLSGYDSLL